MARIRVHPTRDLSVELGHTDVPASSRVDILSIWQELRMNPPVTRSRPVPRTVLIPLRRTMRREMSATNRVPGFAPSLHGLHFANRWEPGPTIRLGVLDPRLVGVGDAKAGLCGGMAWFVRERFEIGLPVPEDRVAPANGSPLFRSIVRRQILSLDWLRVPFRFWRAASMAPEALARHSLEVAWPRIRAAIDAGRLSMVGLTRHHGPNPFELDRDHQVLAFGYTIDGSTITLQIYDPNWPDRDDVTISLGPEGMGQSTGERLLGTIALP